MCAHVHLRSVSRLLALLHSLLLAVLLPLIIAACGTPQPSPPQAMVYDSSQAGIIYALSAQDGSVRWQYHTVDTLFGAALARPTLLNGTIYAATSSGGIIVYALNAQNGSARWRVKLSDIPTPPEQPVIVNNVLYLVASRADTGYATEVYALRTEDGSVLWHYQTTSYLSTRNFTVAGGLVYLPIADSSLGPLVALNAATGTIRWWAHLPGASYSTPTVVDGLVIINDSNGWVYALQAAEGTLVWSRQVATPGSASTLAATNDLVYVGADDGSMVALRTSDGTLRWQVHLADIAFVPVVAQGIVFAVSDEGSYPVYALRASDGTTLWQYQSGEYGCIGGVSITIADQVVFCGSDAPYMVLLDASSGLLIRHYTLPANLISFYPVVVGPAI